MAQIQVEHQAAVPLPDVVAPAPGGAQFTPTSLYVGDLDVTITEEQLFQMFGQVARVASVRICRDSATGRSLGYGYVNYSNPPDAARALDLLNFTPLNNKPIRIMYSQRDPSLRKSGAANIFIKNLDKSIDHKALYDTFSSFGNIMSCKLSTDGLGQSKGYGFVQFDNEESAQNAIDKLNGMLINDKQVYVGYFLRKQERETTLTKTKFNNVYVKNLSESTTDEDLKTIFGEYGEITSAVVMRDANGKSKGFGFVNFENADAAANAVEALNGKKFEEKEWYVGKAQKKAEREHELKSRFKQTASESADKLQGVNLYVKNLDDTIDDAKLKELFSEFGNITSCKVMCDPSGISKGSGFVAFSTPEEASRARAEMNHKLVVGKPLYVSLAQTQEERRALLQAQFSQLRPNGIPPFASRVPMYSSGAPGLGHHFFYGQAPPAIIPPQAGFGYQQQLVPGISLRGPPAPNFFVPMVQQGQRPGGQSGAGPVRQTQQPMSSMQQEMLASGRRFLPGRNMPEIPVSSVGGMPLQDAGIGQPMPLQPLAMALANATPEQQRTMLGESLYPLVEGVEHDAAAKVTGMLLEMDQTEVLHLMESPESLKAKVTEAMEVLRNVATPANQLASLSLNDSNVS
ncbi:poly(A) binding protein 2, ARABIDOPSIS POLY(A) BINDING 2, POLY(A) BINDING PROTEIN 2 [Hibiscus trionum]|uniref:Polyadenylate-binding protein n=1 Tax=Hibiscus trionum TaxID=183268 RepID=A0A9W7MDY9_HIBTR|nr:poly(A) binding protein 2, ARABIDOPSIS POLY(A) BINDING 2, POLY(A) BINDING PROTEIN 2 [Hibiscus trionum]